MKRAIVTGTICFLLGTMIGASTVLAFSAEKVFNFVYSSTDTTLRVIGQ